MAASLIGLDDLSSLEQQFFTCLEAFSDLQNTYVEDNPAATPVQVVTSYSRDHLTGVITGSFTMNSSTSVGAAGTVVVNPTPFAFVV
jgi:hypothetical protein